MCEGAKGRVSTGYETTKLRRETEDEDRAVCGMDPPLLAQETDVDGRFEINGLQLRKVDKDSVRVQQSFLCPVQASCSHAGRSTTQRFTTIAFRAQQRPNRAGSG